MAGRPVSISSSAVTIFTSNTGDESPRQADSGMKQIIISLTEQLLAAITFGDFEAFKKLVDPDVTSFEPGQQGFLMKGWEMQKFYFDNVLPNNSKRISTSIINPYVHGLDDQTACIVYTRFTQYLDRQEVPHAVKSQETRIWHKRDGKWLNVHFHRSRD